MADAQQATSPLRGLALVALTIGVGLATFMEVLDTSIVNVSVRTISGDIGVSYDEGTMAITFYSLGSAIVQPLTGWISQRFGEVRTFVVSVGLFVLFSILCGLSPSLNMLIFFRLCQGLVSGPMVPLSQTLLLSNYPAAKRPIALALWAMTVVVAPVFGPVLGGYISDNYHWSWIFFINIPVGIFTVVVALALLRKRETKTVKSPIDAVGLGLLAIGIGCLQFLLDKGNDWDWFSSDRVVVLAVISLVCLTFLIAWELMHDNPVVDLKLFKNRNFTVGVISLSLSIFCFFGGTVVLPTWLQQSEGYTATWSGFAVAPLGLLALFMSPLVGVLQSRFDLRLLNTLGLLVFFFTSFWMAGTYSGIPFSDIALPRLVMGAGIALMFIPVNQIILQDMSGSQVAKASGLQNFCRTIAMSFGTAITNTLYSHRSDFHHARLTEHIHDGGVNTMAYLDRLREIGIPESSLYAELNQTINVQSATLAMDDLFHMYGWFFLGCIVLIWFSRKAKNEAA